MKNNISWDLPTKTHWLATMQAHQEADRFVQGMWLDDYSGDEELFRGCFFGCAMQTGIIPLEKAIKAMKLPPWLIYLAEKIFEGLPVDEANLFPVQLLESIPVDTDLSGVECKQHISRLDRLLDLTDLPDNVISVINGVRDCWTQRLNGIPDSDINWTAAEAAAEAAEWSEESGIFWSAARVARASRAAEAAAEAAVAAASSRAAAAARVAAWSAWSEWSVARAAEAAARVAAWETERDVLIQLLSEVSGE